MILFSASCMKNTQSLCRDSNRDIYTVIKYQEGLDLRLQFSYDDCVEIKL